MKRLLAVLAVLLTTATTPAVYCQVATDSIIRVGWKKEKTIFLATETEIAEARIRIKDFRESTGLAGKNCGYLEGTINGIKVDNRIWVSGEAKPETEPQIFSAEVVKGAGGKSWLRNVDTEYKMLNKVAGEFGAVAGAVYPEVTGQLKIVSERPYCSSCTNVIRQFQKCFPTSN